MKHVILALLLLVMSIPARAGIPTFDATQIAQSIMQTAEQISQTANQVTSYKKQVQEWLLMVHNTEVIVGLGDLIDSLDYAKSTYDDIMGEAEEIQHIIDTMNNTNDFLATYEAVAHYVDCGEECYAEIDLWQSMTGNSDDAIDGVFAYLKRYDAKLRGRKESLEKAIKAVDNAKDQGQVAQLQAQNALLANMSSNLVALEEIQAQHNRAMAVIEKEKAARQSNEDLKFHNQTVRKFEKSESHFFSPTIGG